jgi:hypothetical protein
MNIQSLIKEIDQNFSTEFYYHFKFLNYEFLIKKFSVNDAVCTFVNVKENLIVDNIENKLMKNFLYCLQKGRYLFSIDNESSFENYSDYKLNSKIIDTIERIEKGECFYYENLEEENLQIFHKKENFMVKNNYSNYENIDFHNLSILIKNCYDENPKGIKLV